MYRQPRWKHYWHDFTHPVITNAGNNDEFTQVAEDELGIPGNAQQAADTIENYQSPDRQRGKRGSSAVVITPERNQMPLRRRYGGRRSRGGYHGSRATYGARASNPIIYRKRGRRRGRRRKLRWGTRVRKQALGLFEGKRYVTPVATINDVSANDIQRIALLPGLLQNTDKDTHDDVPGLVDVSQPLGVSAIATSKITGLEFMIRGCKFNLLCKNENVTHPVIVRVICGWRRTYADMGGTAMGVNTLHIFRNTDNDTRMVPLNLTAAAQRNAVWRNANAPIDKKAFHLIKDFKFLLGPKPSSNGLNEEAVHGNHHKQISFWWEMYNKRMNFISDLLAGDSALDKENKMTWYPVVMVYHTNPESNTDCAVDYSYDFCVYYKDPRG